MTVQWSDDLAIGIGIIDDQHKKLVERIASFSRAVESGDRNRMEDTVNYLIGYAIQHFGAEELIMIRNCYDQFKEHRDEHSWFIKEVFDIHGKLACGAGVTREDAEALRDMLVNWILVHISVKDKRIAETLNSFGGPLRK
ncbi:MAG: hemerythrin family protein [Aminivibrio sp.]|jgi:hemerythrin-like metal-binding domain|nr:hemerythrin family protein [Aminivibrio sp.]